MALRLLDDPAEAQLNDYEQFVVETTLTPPPAYDSIAAFNRALVELLEPRHQAMTQAPIDLTLRHGTQTLDRLFLISRDPIIHDLKAMIEQAIRDNCARLPAQAGHPFLERRPADGNVVFTGSWSSRLHDRGFHTDHFHPQGWISGVYYIAIPDVAQSDERQGWLKFGDPSIGPEIRLPWQKAVRPVPGHLVLFPSYFWHGTLPFHSAQPRLTIAFDAVPL